MRRGAAALLTAAALTGSLLLAAPRADARAYGERSAVDRVDCDEACLLDAAKRYMDGLVRQDPARVPFASGVRFTENDVELPIGAGLWRTISAASPHPLLAADIATGNVAWFGTVAEHGAPAYYAMRLKVVDRRIAEVETVVDRRTRWPAPFGDPARLVHDPAFAEVLPPGERRERERLRDVANGYFSTVERNDGDLLTLFDPDCQRIENGISTTQGRYGSAAAAQGCEAQFRLGLFRVNKRVRERRYPLIDEKRGIVVATGFFDHDNTFDRYTTTDGKEHRTLLKWPNSLSLMEAFKIRAGRIYRVEAVFTYVPYFMHSPWVEGGSAPATDAGPAIASASADAAKAGAAPCDRACLGGLAARYMSALARHEPSSLPWAPVVRYAEDGVPMQVGEGEWNTVTGISSADIVAADPATGSVAWLGVVEEHGDPAFYAMRLDEKDGRITSVEAIVDPARGGGPYGEPAMRLPDPLFERAIAPSVRSPRARMIALVRQYSEAHRPSGDRLRGGRFPVVDVERGVIVYTGFVDHPAPSDLPAAPGDLPAAPSDLPAAPSDVPAERPGTPSRSGARTGDGVARDARLPYPVTQGVIEVFKIVGGRIARIAAVSTLLPYGMRDGIRDDLHTDCAQGGGVASGRNSTRSPAAVDQARLANADESPGDWMSHGRTWSEQRFSPLTQINDQNVERLGLAWYADLDTYRGVEGTPLEIDGVLYNVSAWDVTTAYDAATGKVLWTYDPKIPLDWARIACCGPVSRGLAAWKGKIIVAALDGRLIALDARTGRPVWVAQTGTQGQPLSITGAPRIAHGLVIIGNAGGDLGARGYMSAYDAETGRLAWKFYIVPGDPAKGPDGAASDSVMPMAAKTWKGDWWKRGGGGNDWDTIVYDPGLDLVYFGTGNGSPLPQDLRSPGGGDNLFICSIVAVDARTGRYVWHYQEVPGEQWDYDCTSPLMLADLSIGGRLRHVILHAPKDGFFYVLDRATGRLISAAPYVPSTWATRVDLKTGRPVLTPDARLTEKPHVLTPSSGGGHNWNPMSFSPLTGLVYIPTMEQWMIVSELRPEEFKFELGRSQIGASFTSYPELRKRLNREIETRDKGYLLAWDPVRQKEAFRIPYPHPGNGGTLATAGNLLIEGTIDKTLAIYRADDGRKLWEMPVESVPVAGPMSYEVSGRQYIAVNAGWNSAIVHGLDSGGKPFSVAPARLLVFTLDAQGVKLPPAPESADIPPPPSVQEPQALVERGAALFGRYCAICHGQNAVGSGPKDLRHLGAQAHADFDAIVLGGKLARAGMASFADLLTKDDANAIHAYVIERAQEDWQPDFLHPRHAK